VTGARSVARSFALLDAVALVAVKAAISLWVLRHGFSHVSDDDYARTVIAEQFAHAPHLDPSGTSWLPMPFWIEGSAMAALGRSLGVARGVALVLSAASVVAPYAALRAAGVGRVESVVATGIAMALPWSAWLGAATVPESWVGALVGAALVAMTDDRARPWCAAALLAASLSRYEAWPAAAVFALMCAIRSRGRGGGALRREGTWAAVAVLGVASWMIWNLYAHGSALHFLTRVRTFRQAVGAASVPLAEKVLGYPRSLAVETPEVAVLGAIGLAGMAADRTLRARWGWAMGGAAAVLAFLVAGDVRDGAPTHHPARALSPLWWVLVACGVDAIGTAVRRSGRERGALGATTRAATTVAALAWLALLPDRWSGAPGLSDAERREVQIARGEDLARRGVPAAEVTPCSFEHFALLASWAQPERARIHDRLATPPTPACPLVVER
jgi:hypothetical protein